jgi:hypothetical protein
MYPTEIEKRISELANAMYRRSGIKETIIDLRMKIAREAGTFNESVKPFAKLETSYQSMMAVKKILDVTDLRRQISFRYARRLVYMSKAEALDEIMHQLVEYQPSTPGIEYGIRMNCEETALNKTSLSMLQGEIALFEKRPYQKAYDAALAEYLRIFDAYEYEFPVCFGRETKERKYLEEDLKQACLEEQQTTSRIDYLEGELKRLAHDSVQGNLSALPVDYRIARKKGKSVAEAIAISNAVAEELAAKVSAAATQQQGMESLASWEMRQRFAK